MTIADERRTVPGQAIRGAGLLCLALVGAAALAPPAQAATIHKVQKGSFTMANTTCIVDVTAPQFNPVTRDRSFLVFSQRNNGLWAGRTKATGRILPGGTTLRFERAQCASGGTAMTIHWKVAEFSSGVFVQHGEVYAAPQPNFDVTLTTAVDLSKSFPIVTIREAGGDFDRDDFIRAELTSPTNLRLDHTGGGARIAWQVVEYTGARVQSGNVNFGASSASQNATLTPAVDTTKSWLLYSLETGSGGTNPRIGRGLVRGRITSPTNLNFDRDRTGGSVSINLTWYLVEFTDGTTVRHGNMNFTNTQTNKVATFAPQVDPAWSMAAGGYLQIGGKSPYQSNDIPGVAWFQQNVINPTQVRLRRQLTGGTTADFGWAVVAFTPRLYYSIGTETAALHVSTGSAAAGLLTLDAPAAKRVGVGDEIRVGASTRRYYISSRISSTQFRIQDSAAGGGTPADPNVSFASSNLEIYRAFNSVTEAEAESSDAFHLNTADLATNGYQLNWPCYEDGPIQETAGVLIDGYTTGADAYIHLYAPFSLGEVGSPQRHEGVAGIGCRIAPVIASPGADVDIINITDQHVRFTGIELDGSGITNARGIDGFRAETVATDVRFDSIIVHDLRCV